MKWIIILMFLLYFATMIFLVYIRLRPALKQEKKDEKDT